MMDQASTTPPTRLPRYNLSRIFAVRDRLCNFELDEYAGFTPTGKHFEEMVDKFHQSLPGTDKRALYDSLRNLAGFELTPSRLRATAWRLVANIDRLKRGVAVPPWSIQLENEWVPAQVLSWRAEQTSKGRHGGLFSMRILAGTPCPLITTAFWTRGFSYAVARRLGYTSRRHNHPYSHPSELVSMRLWLHIEPGRSMDGAPGFHIVKCSPGLLSWNKSIIKRRFREGWQCPHSFTHYCFQCPIGYSQCPAATHRETIDVVGTATDSDESAST